MTEVVASLQALLKLQKKYEDSAESSGITGFTWKIHKYLSSTTKQNTGDLFKFSKLFPFLSIFQDQSGTSSPKSFSTVHGEMTHQLKKFTYDELRRATMDFGHKACLGYGTYKEVYKGRANNTGFLIAVKRLHHYNLPNGSIAYISYMQRNSAVKHDHMCTQLELLLKEFSHPNLVKLLGYCTKERYLVLAYEFMHKGNFQDCLIYGTIAQLPLVTKVKIAVRVARGIVFLHKTQDAVMIDRYWRGMVSESRLDRHKILLDEDFTAKLSDYDVTKLMHSGYPEYNGERDDYCFAGCQPVKLQTNLSGFTVVLAEVLTGEEISTEYEFKEIAEMFIQHGKTSLFNIAETCFEICNEVDSESKMLKIFEEYEEFTANFQGCYGKQHV
ncbi:hypothetical protein L1887_38338 [Cichorium endivia]|nr:hypothetical protein L1887_38338 [Cichorium endivia]